MSGAAARTGDLKVKRRKQYRYIKKEVVFIRNTKDQ